MVSWCVARNSFAVGTEFDMMVIARGRKYAHIRAYPVLRFLEVIETSKLETAETNSYVKKF